MTVGADGAGALEIHPSFAHQGQLMQLGRAAAGAVFPGHDVRLRIDGNAGGADFVVVRVGDLYAPGPNPAFAFTTEGLGSALVPYGIVRIEFGVCPPEVDSSIQARPQIAHPCEERNPIDLNAQRLDLSLHLRPSTKNPWPPQVMIWANELVLLGALLSFRGRTSQRLRRITIPLGLAAIGAVVAADVAQNLGSFATADDAGISGRWTGWFLNLAQANVLIGAFEFFAAVALVGVGVSMLAQAKRRELFAGIPWRPDVWTPRSS